MERNKFRINARDMRSQGPKRDDKRCIKIKIKMKF